ncbi:MAG: hypothetical protein C0394_07980 [Syntrophus sp. (in: bacteria)]|nr:hypothetical protein [Syntrophus sp. (in: bacteria)]
MASFSSLFAQETKTTADVKAAPAPPVAASAAVPVEDKPTGDVTVAAMSQYFWRGYELSRNSVVVQPSITVAYKGFSANLWGNLDTKPYFQGTADPNYAGTWNETDFTLSYTRTMGMLNVGGGYIYYGLGALNRDAPKRADAQEIFVTASLNKILSPTLTVYKEIGHYQNWYFLFGVSHMFELNRIFSLKLEATASYLMSAYADAAKFNAGAGYGGYPRFDGKALATDEKFSNFHDGKVTVSLPIKVTRHISLMPTISWIFPLSDDAKNEMKGQGLKGTASPTDRDSSFIVGGLTASLAF